MGVWQIVALLLTGFTLVLAFAGGIEVLRRLRGHRRLLESVRRAQLEVLESRGSPQAPSPAADPPPDPVPDTPPDPADPPTSTPGVE